MKWEKQNLAQWWANKKAQSFHGKFDKFYIGLVIVSTLGIVGSSLICIVF